MRIRPLGTKQEAPEERAEGQANRGARAGRTAPSVLASRIRLARYERGWGPAELADMARISRTALFQIESGRTRRPRAVTLARIAEALGLEPEALTGSTIQLDAAPASPRPSSPAPRAMVEAVQSSSTIGHEALLRKVGELLASPYAGWVSLAVEMAHRLLEPESDA